MSRMLDIHLAYQLELRRGRQGNTRQSFQVMDDSIIDEIVRLLNRQLTCSKSSSYGVLQELFLPKPRTTALISTVSGRQTSCRCQTDLTSPTKVNESKISACTTPPDFFSGLTKFQFSETRLFLGKRFIAITRIF
jgi:hypothetical protein